MARINWNVSRSGHGDVEALNPLRDDVTKYTMAAYQTVVILTTWVSGIVERAGETLVRGTRE